MAKTNKAKFKKIKSARLKKIKKNKVVKGWQIDIDTSITILGVF